METTNFTDEDGNRFDLTSDIYNPRKREVNSLIVASVGRQLIAGTFQDW